MKGKVDKNLITMVVPLLILAGIVMLMEWHFGIQAKELERCLAEAANDEVRKWCYMVL